MKKRAVLIFKIAVVIVIVGWLGWTIYGSWGKVRDGISSSDEKIAINWIYGLAAMGGFCANMLTSGLVWRWLARKMGDRSPAVPMIAAYTFSQMAKYLPGKVWLLFVRVERTGRFGMAQHVCTLSTILENALYMISGGLVGMTAIVHLTEYLNPRFRPFVWPLTILIVLLLLVVCYPPAFYGLVNRVMRRLKKTEVPRGEQLGIGALTLAVIGFVPCWIFGGVALWASTQAVHQTSVAGSWWFPGAFALSVIFGMASFLPGGALVRESVLSVAVMLELTAEGVPQDKAWLIAGIVAILQRLFQLIAEGVMGVSGAIVTSAGARVPATDAPQGLEVQDV